MAKNSVVASEATLEAPAQIEQFDRNQSPEPTELDEIDSKTKKELSVLQLPSDRSKTPFVKYQPAYYSFYLPDHLVKLLSVQIQPEKSIDAQILKAKRSKSLFLSVITTLLHRYTQQNLIQLGLIISNSDINQNIITEISTQISNEIKVQELINHIAETLEISVQSGLQKSRDQSQLDHSQLKPSVIVTFLEHVSSIEDGKRWMIELHQRNSAFICNLDLHFALFQQEQSISGILEYNTNLFEPDTIERLSGHFQVLSEGMLKDLGSTITRLPLLTQAEQHQLLTEWKSPSVNYPQIPIHQKFEAKVAQNPDAIALEFGEQQLTYAELNQRANQLAHYLKQLGIGAESRVAVCVQPSLEIGIGLLGILKAGGVYVPLDPTHPEERLTLMMEDTQAKVLLTQADLLPNLPPFIEHVICLDKDWETICQFPAHNFATEVTVEQTAYMIYTSGTTGKPKGVMASHGNLVNYILATQERLGFDHHDVMPSIARYTFSISLFELLSPLAAGGTLVLLDRDQVLDFARLTQILEQLTMIHTVPSLMQQLLNYIKDNEIDVQKFQGIKHVFTGGDTVAPDLLEALKNVFQNANVCVLYGCSEISSLCSTYPVPRNQTITQSRIGKPFNNVVVRLYDPHQNLVPIGIPGEIYVGGAGVTKGYLNREDLTQEKFVTIEGQRFYRTGDLGRFRSDGNLEFLGRADFQIKLRGIRIELGDIETTLRQAPGVREGVVMAHDLGSGDNRLVAYMVLAQGQNPEIETIRRFLQSKLPDYMVPAAFVVLDAMPLNVNRKLDRRALPVPTAEHLTTSTTLIPPRNECEQQLSEIWKSVLGIPSIGVTDKFIDLGGNSLLAASLISQIQKTFDQTLPLSTLIMAPTIEQQAALLSQTAQARNSLVLLREGGSEPPVFFIHDGQGEVYPYQNLANCLKPEHPVYGIQPYSRRGNAILHTRIHEITAYYIEQIRTVQPEGPYLLSGLCAGGILAFEVARQLQRQGQTVAMVGLLEAADVEATERVGLIADQRLSRFSQVFSETQHLKPHQRFVATLCSAKQKICNAITYEVQKKIEVVQDQVQLSLFRYYLDQELPLPKFLHNLPVEKVLKFAEQDYIPQELYEGEVLLFRATEGDGNDQPFINLYSDPLFGWGKRVTQNVKVCDVPGGHSSMLQSPNVQILAEQMQAYITEALLK